MNYKSGDLVKIAGNNNNHDFSMGEIVRLKHNCGGEHRVWVAEYLDGHDFWYVIESDMKPYKPTIMPQKIVITTDGKTTLARLFDGKTMVKRAEAKCAPSDTFNFGVGAELAVKRLMGVRGNPITEPISESKPVKLYCVKDYRGNLTRGKIYEVKDGFMRYDDGSKAFMQWMDIAEDIKESWLFEDGYLVPLVRRPAKVGEWVYVIDSTNEDVYRKNDVCEVVAENRGIRGKIDGVYIRTVSGKTLDCCQISGTAFLYDQEYLVLDGYTGDPV